MSDRELIVLGTASQAPTRERNHNGYLLRWDGTGFLFDPGEGAQRQMTFAGNSGHDVHQLCLTHFHGDHCLGVPGIVQRLSQEGVTHPVTAHYPASGSEHFARLRNASVFLETADLRERPIRGSGVVTTGPFGTLEARRLDHPVESFGYRLREPDGRRMLPELLERHEIRGPDVARLQRAGEIERGGHRVTVEEVSQHRPGQRFAFVMDTRLCSGVHELADGADLLVIESTFLERDSDLAGEYGHLTAAQAARVATESGVRALVLTHFSRRYSDPAEFRAEAAAEFTGELMVAEDLMTVPMPERR